MGLLTPIVVTSFNHETRKRGIPGPFRGRYQSSTASPAPALKKSIITKPVPPAVELPTV